MTNAKTATSIARSRLIVALDLPTVPAARQMVAQLGESVSFYKIGMELIYAGGLDLVRDLVSDGKDVFVDLNCMTYQILSKKLLLKSQSLVRAF